MTYQYIYKATNEINGKVYIGITVNFNKRKRMHEWVSKNPQKEYTYYGHFQRAIRLYGSENFKWEILLEGENVSKEDEIKFIEQFQSDNPERGYNLTKGGDGNLGWIPSEETREKIRIANIGNKSSLGRILSEDTKRKIGQANAKWKRTPEHLEKLHAKGIPALNNPENRAKGVATRKANGYRHSEETRRKIGEGRKKAYAKS